MNRVHFIRTAPVMVALLVGCAEQREAGGPIASAPPRMAMTTAIPENVATPASVETRLGTLEFFDGLPSRETVKKAYDHLDFMRGVRVFLDTIPYASLHAMREGLRDVGAVDGTVGIFETLMDSKTLFLTANTESIYAFSWLDLKDGPIVVESPPNTLGFVDDFFFGHVADLGNAGPDRGQGGKFLFLPPGYEGDVPEGYFTYQSATNGNWLVWRGFLVDGDPQPGVISMKQNIHIYPFAKRENPPEQQFINLSGREFNTIHANDVTFFEEVDQVIQEEPVDSLDPEILGALAAIGIEKGRGFLPDERMKGILTDAAAVANATARALIFATRDREAFIYEGSAWKTGFIGGSHEFIRDGVRLLDGRTLFFYYATGITPAMATRMVGVGSQYAGAAVDSDGRAFEGGKTYRLHFPPDVPAKDFWSVVLYDNQTRSMLQTDQQFPSLNSQRDVEQNADGSTDIYFGPEAPEGNESNWIQTVPGKGWSVILRFYGPLESWFDQSWRPGEVEWLQDAPIAEGTGGGYEMTTDVPPSITTPERVETRIGTLEFVDGFPTPDTVKRVYDNLDFIRGVEAFLSTMPGASLVAMRQGFADAGIAPNGAVGIHGDLSHGGLMSPKSLYLTANTESVYYGGWLDLEDGPMVVESPPNTLGMVNDFFFRYVADLGNAGPDGGQGGKFVFLPPDYEGEVPEGYFVFRSPTYGNWLFWRGFLENGDAAPGIAAAREYVRVYPLARPELRDKQQFIDVSGVEHNTIHANDGSFFEEIHTLIDEEPAAAFSPEILGLLAGIGIEKGKPMPTDASWQARRSEAAAVGNATARAITFRQHDRNTLDGTFYYDDSAWFTPFVGGSHEFMRNGARLLDARTMFHYPATAISPAMVLEIVGVGSQYGIAAVDADGAYLDGSKTYRLRLPAGIPAKDFWSVVIYDPQTRSLLQTDQAVPSLNSQRNNVEVNSDGSTDIYFSPDVPKGEEANWVQTVPHKGWFAILRLYGPLEPWFDKTWRPGEIERVN